MKTTAVYVGIIILMLVGEVKCVIKAIKCNWQPIGKSEIIYTGAAFTGLGCIIGWMDIKGN